MSNVRKLQTALPQCQLVDVAGDTARQRMIKSPEEIEVIKVGAATADIGGEACRAAVVAGAREWEVARQGVTAMISHISHTMQDRAELLDTWVWFQSGLNTDGAHNPLTNRRLQTGDILSLNCFPMIQGYYTALERTMFYKHTPSDAALKAQQFSPLQTCVYLCHLQGVLNIAKIPPPRRPGKTGHQNVKISRTILAIFGPISRSISNDPILS